MIFLYVIQESRENFVKIGVSMDVDERLKVLQTANPGELSVLYTFSFPDPGQAHRQEDLLHQHFKHTRIKGEWFGFTKYMEGFFDEWDKGEEERGLLDVWLEISDADCKISSLARNYCHEGNYNAAEYIIKELKETIKDIERIIPT